MSAATDAIASTNMITLDSVTPSNGDVPNNIPDNALPTATDRRTRCRSDANDSEGMADKLADDSEPRCPERHT